MSRHPGLIDMTTFGEIEDGTRFRLGENGRVYRKLPFRKSYMRKKDRENLISHGHEVPPGINAEHVRPDDDYKNLFIKDDRRVFPEHPEGFSKTHERRLSN